MIDRLTENNPLTCVPSKVCTETGKDYQQNVHCEASVDQAAEEGNNNKNNNICVCTLGKMLVVWFLFSIFESAFNLRSFLRDETVFTVREYRD